MRYKRILLVDPFYHFSWNIPPVGLGYVAESLRQHSILYNVMDMTIGYKPKQLIKKIQYFNPDLIGFSMMSLKYKSTYSLFKDIKENFSNIDIVCGGPHISILRQQILTECPSIDYGIVFEGEDAIIELCEGRNPNEIKGLIYRDKDEIFYAGDRPFNINLDSVTFPTYYGFEMDKYVPRQISISTSRGCPFDCIYCSANLVAGKKMRMRSGESVFKEISFWYEKGYRIFRIIDDAFTLDKSRVIAIADKIKEAKWEDAMFTCTNGIRIDCVDYELLNKMKEAGFRRLAFGVESGNNRVLQYLKKQQQVDEIKNAVGLACELNYDVTLFFLVGSPYEGWKEIRESVKLALEFPVLAVYFFSLRPYPNTELYDWVKENGHFAFLPEVYLNDNRLVNSEREPFFWTEDFPFRERKRALRYVSKVSQKVIRNTLKRKFNKFGILRYPLVYVGSLTFFQNLVKHNRFLKTFAYKFLFKD